VVRPPGAGRVRAVDARQPLLERFGALVRALRTARGWSRRELAQRSGMSERFLADVELGSANPSLLRLADLASALDLGLAGLLGGLARDARRTIALLGLRGAGKSTVGEALARRLGVPFVELDTQVEKATGLSLGEIFQVHGEDYYRRAERQALERLLTDAPQCVVATGGGIVTDPANFALLRGSATTVWLRAEPEDHWQRVIAQGDTRPMADNERAFQDLRRILEEREPLYRQADITVATSTRTVEQVTEEILQRLQHPLVSAAR